ncbi:MAG: L-threonylcarbamoyladenylate synthase [Flavobacteriaceae bacterium]|nr:L-threonylcarbamoyladenylate synthase [Flavobacteriaceae bacterium]
MAELLKLYSENPHPRTLDKVVDVLKRGGLIIYPTDTVYALGCDVKNTKAMERIARIKGIKLERAQFSFICHNLSHLSDYTAQLDASTFKLVKRYFPGPYTFILPSNKALPHPFKKRKTVGIRVPDHPIALELVRRLGNPIVSTSIHDEDDIVEYTTDPELIYEKWQKNADIVIDNGFGGNIASTVIDLTQNPPVLVREGKGQIDFL